MADCTVSVAGTDKSVVVVVGSPLIDSVKELLSIGIVPDMIVVMRLMRQKLQGKSAGRLWKHLNRVLERR